jgi:hypothetical protein
MFVHAEEEQTKESADAKESKIKRNDDDDDGCVIIIIITGHGGCGGGGGRLVEADGSGDGED